MTNKQIKLSDYHVYSTKDDLPPHLRRFCVQDGPLTFFKHPMIVTLMPLLIPLPVDEFLEQKRQWVEEGLRAHKSPISYIQRHERAFRSGTFIELLESGYWDGAQTSMRQANDFWKCAAYVWTDCEESEEDDIWNAILTADIPYREFMTSAADRRKLKEMGGYITIYRGVQGADMQEAFDSGVEGFQWTLDMKTAVFFSHRFIREPDRGFVLKTTIPTSEVVAYLSSRGESEIIVWPDNIILNEVDIVEVSSLEAHEVRSGRKSSEFADALLMGFNRAL